jgi:hypothetical protein
MFVTGDSQTVLDMQPVGMFLIYIQHLRNKRYTPSKNASFFTVINSEKKKLEKFRKAAILIFQSLQNY